MFEDVRHLQAVGPLIAYGGDLEDVGGATQGRPIVGTLVDPIGRFYRRREGEREHLALRMQALCEFSYEEGEGRALIRPQFEVGDIDPCDTDRGQALEDPADVV